MRDFYKPGVLPVTQLTWSKHWRNDYSEARCGNCLRAPGHEGALTRRAYIFQKIDLRGVKCPIMLTCMTTLTVFVNTEHYCTIHVHWCPWFHKLAA